MIDTIGRWMSMHPTDNASLNVFFWICVAGFIMMVLVTVTGK